MTRAFLILMCLCVVARADGPKWNLDTPSRAIPAPRVEPPKEKRAAPPEAPSVLGNPVRKPEPGGGVQPKPSNPTGLKPSNSMGLGHSPDAGKMVAKRPVVHFHHCLKGCKPCPDGYAWMYHYGKHLVADLVIHEYPTLDDAGAAGVPFVPSVEINGRFMPFYPHPDAHKTHGSIGVCPKCINDWIRSGGKWPPGHIFFDNSVTVRIVRKRRGR